MAKKQENKEQKERFSDLLADLEKEREELREQLKKEQETNNIVKQRAPFVYAPEKGGDSYKIVPKTGMSWKYLQEISIEDPVVWAIKKTLRSLATQVDWDIVPDMGVIKDEVDRWQEIELNNVNPWGLNRPFSPITMSEENYKELRLVIRRILAEPIPDEDKKAQLRHFFAQSLDWLRQTALSHCKEVRDIFDQPNLGAESSFRALQELIIEDISVFDAGCIAKRYNRGGGLYELYHLPGQFVWVLRYKDGTVPQPPKPAYLFFTNGVPVDDSSGIPFTNKELVYIMSSPQQDGYGFSPTRACAFISAAAIRIDQMNREYAIDFSMPPKIINMPDKDRTEIGAIQVEFDQRMRRENMYKLFFVSGTENMEMFDLSTSKAARDMQMQEYIRLLINERCACFGLSPQDIGMTVDLHRTTAQVQYKITETRGIRSLLTLLQSYYNQEIVKRDFPFKDVKFTYLGIDITDPLQEIQFIDKAIRCGAMSVNTGSQRIGEPPVVGGNVRLIQSGQNLVPVASFGAQEEGLKENKPDNKPADEQQPMAPENPIVVNRTDLGKHKEIIQKLVSSEKLEKFERKWNIMEGDILGEKQDEDIG